MKECKGAEGGAFLLSFGKSSTNIVLIRGVFFPFFGLVGLMGAMMMLCGYEGFLLGWAG